MAALHLNCVRHSNEVQILSAQVSSRKDGKNRELKNEEIAPLDLRGRWGLMVEVEQNAEEECAETEGTHKEDGERMATCLYHTEQVFYCQAASLCAVVCRCVPCTMSGRKRGNREREIGNGEWGMDGHRRGGGKKAQVRKTVRQLPCR
jgi:hypothetical protein